MEIKLRVTRENEDGSADAIVDYDDEGQIVLIQYGVVAMLKEAIEQEKQVKKKKVNKDLMYQLEDDIEKFYSIIDDLELLYKTHGDRKTPMSEDEVGNNLLGVINKAKMVHYWALDTYCRCFELNDYASDEVKKRRLEILQGWDLDDEDPDDIDGRC
jgi:hypothetical protein